MSAGGVDVDGTWYLGDCAMQGHCICSADCKCSTDVCKEAVGQMSK